jgi:hypothetical protein
MAREGLEIAARQGSTLYGFNMVGNAVVCALRTGDWDWADALLADWLSIEITGQFFVELYVDRAIMTALRGADPSADIGEADRLLPGMTDLQFASYVQWAHAWASFCAGRLSDAGREALAAVDTTSLFGPLALPLAGRAALWAEDLSGAKDASRRIGASVYRGQALGLDLATIDAGIAALEGRRADAIAGYRDVLRGWRSLGLAFDEALAIVDLATVLAPSVPEMPEASGAIEAARATLVRLRAKPILDRLDSARPTVDGTPSRAERSVSGRATTASSGS